MMITEIFYSIQGEIDIGKPAVFVRLFGCNMIPKCNFCDSKHSWEKTGKEMTTEDIYNEIKKYNCTNIIFTGGEPTLKLESIMDVIIMLNNHKNDEDVYNFGIETNGLINDELLYEFDNINCSPKRQNYDIDVLKDINLKISARFKFVYEHKNDCWWEELIKEVGIVNEDVYIMPEGKTKEAQKEKMEEVIEYCKEKGYNFTPRLHTLIWGEELGR